MIQQYNLREKLGAGHQGCKWLRKGARQSFQTRPTSIAGGAYCNFSCIKVYLNAIPLLEEQIAISVALRLTLCLWCYPSHIIHTQHFFWVSMTFHLQWYVCLLLERLTLFESCVLSTSSSQTELKLTPCGV